MILNIIMKMKLTILYLFVLISCSNGQSKPGYDKDFEAKVVGIKDGDTFKVLYENTEVTVRLAHIDCPEKGQAFGKNAKQFASDLCFGKEVRIVSNGKTDRNKRLIVEVYVNDTCVNKELVINGLAWHYKKYSTDMEYSDLEEEANENKVGLWAEDDPIAPWLWRKM
jgi:micrococcal nuclease